jgi:GNAT superfamily N-acetyltransferase
LRPLYDESHEFHVEGVPGRLLIPTEPLDSATFAEAIQRILADDRATLLVAEEAQDVLGFAEMYLRDDDPSPYAPARRYAHLQSLAVTSVRRRRGVEDRLLAAAEQWAIEQGASEIRTDVWEFEAGPLPFYERAGYRTLRRTIVKDAAR